ncbi:hypothetical protein AB0I00_24040 [Streptomyces sp. NPDC050803]|uniref:hypothetical protein n=1 Tax=unclassified Streptomyces TaxID=2593676 RepID=UPI0034326DC8
MGNSHAHPVFRTADLAAAVSTARQLIDLADSTDGEVSFEATVSGARELERLRACMPPVTEFGYGQSPAIQPATGATSVSPFPMFVSWTAQPVGKLEDLFAAAVGKCPATLVWSRLRWPAVPALRLPAEDEHAHVSLSANSRQLHWDEPAPDHTVYIHDRQGSYLRPQWLAEQIGLHLIGPPRLAQ